MESIMDQIDIQSAVNKICEGYLEKENKEEIEQYNTVFPAVYSSIQLSISDSQKKDYQKGTALAFIPDMAGQVLTTTITVIVYNFVVGLAKTALKSLIEELQKCTHS